MGRNQRRIKTQHNPDHSVFVRGYICDTSKGNASNLSRRSLCYAISPNVQKMWFQDGSANEGWGLVRFDDSSLNSVVRPGLVRATRTTTLSNRRNSSAIGTDSPISPSPVDGYALPSGDPIPSVGSWVLRASGEDAGKATKVVPDFF